MKNFKMQEIDFRVVKENQMVSIGQLKLKGSYQRAVQQYRIKAIKDSMLRHGYLPQYPITVNQNWEIVDGQHRYKAARDCEIDRVPITMMSFGDESNEARFFCLVNDYNTKLKPVDYWYGRYMGYDPLARCIYELESDAVSEFYQNIQIKGKETNYKFHINDVLTIFNTAIRNNGHFWTRGGDAGFVKAVVETPYWQTLQGTNDVAKFMRTMWGNKKNNPLAYHSQSVRGTCLFYLELKNQGHLENGFKPLGTKFRDFPIEALFKKWVSAGDRKLILIQHYNKNKTKNRLDIKT